jgi:hypothetical protein
MDLSADALRLGVLLKHNRKRSWSVRSLMNKGDSSKFHMEYVDVRSDMEDALFAVLPGGTDWVSATGFGRTEVTHVFYGECTKLCCGVCPAHRSVTAPRRAPLTYRDIEAILSVCDLHMQAIDRCQAFLDNVMHACAVGNLPFQRTATFMGRTADRRKCQSSINREYRRHTTMVAQLAKMAPAARIRWATLRRDVRMRVMARVLFSHLWGWLPAASRVVEPLPRELQLMVLRQVACKS